jgi:DNA invertase Pin-like site-specific DNA recombinase
MSDKILLSHLQRRAAIYLRQSTVRQVHEHPESTARQYALQQRAVELGWSADRVDLIDEDLGQSGTGTAWRPGFKRLAEDVAHGRIGAIFALEVSRLARCSADWHRLLDLCGLADVVLIDEQAVYTPRNENDRLLLGLKGTMSEVEQTWMRLRLQGGKLNKARRGELHLRSPIGYEWDEAHNRYRFDSDEQIQRAIQLVFKRFRLDGSAYAVVRYFARHRLQLPGRNPVTGEPHWIAPRYSLVLRIIHNPAYAGVYVFGRTEQRMTLVDGNVRRRCVTYRSQDAWKVCLYNRHPAYISWEEFMANQHRLRDNLTSLQLPDQRGAAREGQALLQGLVLCGKCGHRMTVYYQGRKAKAQYRCRATSIQGDGGFHCWVVPSRRIDEATTKLFLEAVQPSEIELGLAVAREAEHQAAEVERQWKLRLDRAEYEVRLAERRYKAVDPDNRVVAQTLEREWNDNLRELEVLKQELQQMRQHNKLELTEHDRVRILALAKDLAQVWNAGTTTHAERKNLLRMLVEQVTLSPIDIPQRMTRVQLLWRTGAISEFVVPRPTPLASRLIDQRTITAIQELAHGQKSDAQIAVELNRRGLFNSQNHPWRAQAVYALRTRYGIQSLAVGPKSRRRPDRRPDGLYSIHGVAARFHVTDNIVRYWIEKGWLTPVQSNSRDHTWWFQLDRATLSRLQRAKSRGYGPRLPRDSQTSATRRRYHE